MSDLLLTWDVWAADLAIAANDLATDDGLRTAVIVSLFTDRRTGDADELPDGQRDRRGWWADAFPVVAEDRVGSRLWLLGREKQLPAVIARAREYALEAVQWLVDDRVAAAVDVTATVGRPGWLVLSVTITRPTTDQASFRFDYAWTAEAARTEAA